MRQLFFLNGCYYQLSSNNIIIKRMKTKIWILGCVICLGCGSGDDKPENILSKKKMVGLMIDVQIAQTRVNDLRLKKDSAQQVYDQYHAYLLDEQVVEDSAFYESLRYYLNRPNDLNLMHEAVLDTLNLRLQKMEAQEEKDKKDKEVQDSLKHLDKIKEFKVKPKKLS